jgi:hypothetical protein
MSDVNLDARVLESYIEGFYGHGSYGAKYWFVGMEFGGGGSWAEIERRIQGWHDRGGRELEDLGPHGIGAGSRWFLPNYPLQPTWKQLIRVVLSAEGSPALLEDIRAYQRDRLGRRGGQDCLLELLPLPSPGLNRWQFYPELARRHDPRLLYLGDRATYTHHVAPARAAHLRERIVQHKPRAVVFYGTGYEHWWRRTAGVDFRPSVIDRVWTSHNDHTLFVIMQHPTARGLSSTYFDAVGRLIAGSPPP